MPTARVAVWALWSLIDPSSFWAALMSCSTAKRTSADWTYIYIHVYIYIYIYIYGLCQIAVLILLVGQSKTSKNKNSINQTAISTHLYYNKSFRLQFFSFCVWFARHSLRDTVIPIFDYCMIQSGWIMYLIWALTFSIAL